MMTLLIGLIGCSNNTASTTVGDILQNQKEIKWANYNQEVFLNNDKEIGNFMNLIAGIQVNEISHDEFKAIFHSNGKFRYKQESLSLIVSNKDSKEEPPSIVIEITPDGNFTLNELDEKGKVITDYLITEKDKSLYKDVKVFFDKE